VPLHVNWQVAKLVLLAAGETPKCTSCQLHFWLEQSIMA